MCGSPYGLHTDPNVVGVSTRSKWQKRGMGALLILLHRSVALALGKLKIEESLRSITLR